MLLLVFLLPLTLPGVVFGHTGTLSLLNLKEGIRTLVKSASRETFTFYHKL
jgi:hypothetical protein